MRKRVIFLKMSLLLVCLSVRAQAVMPAHVSIDILGFDTYNGVAIACKHNPQGSFQATHAFAPDPRVETIISGPVLTWTISPATDVSLAPPAGNNTTYVDVKMENDAAYGKVYTVKVEATWKVRMTATGKIETVKAPEASVKLVAKDKAIVIDIVENKPNNVRSGLDISTLKVKINDTDVPVSELILETVYDPVLVDGLEILAKLKVIYLLCCRNFNYTGGNTVTVDIDDMVKNHMPQKMKTF